MISDAGRDTTELDALLDAAVRKTTGIPTAQARPAQRQISHRMWQVIASSRPRPTLSEEESNGFPRAPHCALEAPTGSGKGLAYLTPAVLAAVKWGRRAVVSTESIALQTQLVKKDFPAVAAAAMEAYGREVRVAVHKGWANFVCLLRTAYAAAELADDPTATRNRIERNATPADLKQLGDLAAARNPEDGPLLQWALAQASVGGEGDKASCNVPGASEKWDDVSIDPDSCMGSRCPLFDLCFPEKARQRAAEADVVVANHSLLAVQAAKAVPAVIGNRRIGDIDVVIVDEAHTLPGQVRSVGASMISGRSITSIQRALERAVDTSTRAFNTSAKAATVLAEHIEMELARHASGDQDVRLEPGTDPLKRSGDAVNAWVKSARNMLRPLMASGHGPSMLAAQSVSRRLDDLLAAMKDVRDGGLGFARWVTRPADQPGRRTWTEAHASPVRVGPLLFSEVYSAPVELEEEDKHTTDLSFGPPKYALPVVTCSATMPTTFVSEAGLDCEMESFESPFAAAYDECLLYVPKPGDVPMTQSWGGRRRMDTFRHPEWALGQMVQLIEASGGRALVLAAKADTGRMYAEKLREHARGRWNVLDAWSLTREAAVAQWRADETSVLVGTRGLMTGVDAPGPTCSLVIIDRIPRAAANPVDEARKEVAAAKVGKWKADRLVYVADAAALLEQAAGRLVRSMGCRGMVAVLDPRLLRGEIAYGGEARTAYLEALGHFSRRTVSLDRAVAYLRDLVKVRESTAPSSALSAA